MHCWNFFAHLLLYLIGKHFQFKRFFILFRSAFVARYQDDSEYRPDYVNPDGSPPGR